MSLSACQLSYIAKNGWNQAKLYASRESISQMVENPDTNPELRKKLQLVIAAKKFCKETLGLRENKNYLHYIQLQDPFVTYIVHASPQYILDSYRWTFPLIGSVPYKGFFSRDEARKEAADLEKKGFDTYIRGVSAYSTLGWFSDPVWSSMIRYDDPDLVNTIIHESIHVHLFIKNQVEFNEQMATFMGDLGTELFFRQPQYYDSTVSQRILDERHDQSLFSEFIKITVLELTEILKTSQQLSSNEKDKIKANFFKNQSLRFKTEVQTKMITKNYEHIEIEKFNNAQLLSYSTYVQDFKDFENLKRKHNSDFRAMLESLVKLEKSIDPIQDLKNL